MILFQSICKLLLPFMLILIGVLGYPQNINTVFVDCNNSNASDSNSGTEAFPFKTIQAAINNFDSPYGNIIVKEGLYFENVEILKGGISEDNKLRIIGQNAEITGSDIYTGHWRFNKLGIWESLLDSSLTNISTFQDINNNSKKITERAILRGFYGEITKKTIQIFQNRNTLKQVNSVFEVLSNEGTFYLNSNLIFINTIGNANPNACKIEFAVRKFAFKTATPGIKHVQISGFKIRDIADKWPLPPGGAISVINGYDWIISQNQIDKVNGTAISIPKCSNCQVKDNIITEAGISGIAAPYAPQKLLIAGNKISNSCLHNVQLLHESAAIKLHQSKNSIIENNVILNIQFGCGIWLDYNNQNNRITGNTIMKVNTILGGIFIEASPKPNTNLIDNNTLIDIQGTGILTRVSDSVIVAFNLISKTKNCINLNPGNSNRRVNGRLASNNGHLVFANILSGSFKEVNVNKFESLKFNVYNIDGKKPRGFNINDNLTDVDIEFKNEQLKVDNVPKICFKTDLSEIEQFLINLKLSNKCFFPGPFYIRSVNNLIDLHFLDTTSK